MAEEEESVWVLIPPALKLDAVRWMLSFYPTAGGCVYTAYGGVYHGVVNPWL